MQQILGLKTILYMLTIEREGSFKKAANSLYISQPALSQHINRIEDELTYPLYDHNKGKCIPTKSGEILLKEGKKLLEDYSTMLEKMRSAAGLNDVYTGWPTGYTVPILNKLLSYMEAHNPSQVHITEDSVEVLTSMLLKGDLDVVFMPIVYASPDIIYTTVKHEEFFLTVPKQHPANTLIKKKLVDGYVDMRDLADFPFIIIDAKAYTDLFYALFKEFNKKPNVILSCKDWGRCYLLAEQGSGLSVLPYWYANKKNKYLDFYHIKSKYHNYRVFGYAIRKDKLLTPSIQIVINYMINNYGDEHAGKTIDQDKLAAVFRF